VTRLFISSLEPSADQLAKSLLAHIIPEDIEVSGVGETSFKEFGLTSLFPMKELSLMGFFEVVPHLLKIKKRMNEMVSYVLNQNIETVVTIDGPSFHLPFAKLLKKKNPHIKIIHYVAPTVWAWKAGRASLFSRFFDYVMTLFPFEPSYFSNGVFVGHPLVETITKHSIDLPKDMILLLPGSRLGEIRRMLPIFQKTVIHLPHDYIYGCFTLPHLKKDLQDLIKIPLQLTDIPLLKQQFLSRSIGAIITSGTLSLELALMGIPHVVNYAMNPLTFFIAKRLVNIPFISLPNILLNKKIIPELIQGDCYPYAITQALDKILEKPELFQSISEELKHILQTDGISPSQKAAEVVLNLMR
jgi:lipid-A-disaccharide synthase